MSPQNAFHTVWQEGVVYKEISSNKCSPMCQAIYNYLKSCSFDVKIDSTMSEAGVHHGEGLSAPLSHVFVSDLVPPSDQNQPTSSWCGLPALCHISSYQIERIRMFERKCLRSDTHSGDPLARNIICPMLLETASTSFSPMMSYKYLRNI